MAIAENTLVSHSAILRFTEHLLATDRSQKTVIGYQSDLRNFERFYCAKYNGPWFVEETTREDVEDFLAMLTVEKRMSPASRNRILYGLKSFFRFMEYKGICEKNVAEAIEPVRYAKKERHFLSEEAIHDFIRQIDHPMIQVATTTLAYTGMRISECTRLRMKDVDLESRTIAVLNGKGKRDRNIPISDKLYPVLKRYRDLERSTARPDERFFATEQTGSLSASYFNHVLVQTSERLGLKKKVTAHVFRHSIASNLIRKGVNVVQVQKLLGHSSLQITSVYTHATLEDLANAVNTL
ncbi:tyrosine-type recombinase/integrase [Alicyclobacillus tolerans]|uniref:tyrosine-type recombinase/integrase n=1 Tax=Alicyclobacillus tolerans TaxID=90970 RepID=UPI001F011FE9|nr:tyrosine-type recombinase/integrase [Alicyclobacillus tolerans]MCF8568489.1 tyrosine-type recombinase/integrase [Alicyclobacillus tolerans]